MATAALPASPPKFRTAAELQDYVGGVPPGRIRLEPFPGTGTEADVLAIHAQEGRICELIDGILVEKPMSSYESRVAAVLIFFIETFLDKQDLGVVLGEAGLLRLFPGRVRAPDVSFISWNRMPNREFPREAIASLAPDLAVEILSEGNTDAEIHQKLTEYFQAGTKLAWIVDPEDRTVRAYTSLHRSVLLKESNTLDGKKVLPGFSLPIKKWFTRASRRPRA